MSEKDIVNYLLEVDDELKNTYEVYQDLIFAIKYKDSKSFLNIINEKHLNVSDYMKTSLKTLKMYKEYVVNALENEASNGKLEATNNLIKVIKRNAYGFRNFLHS